MPRNAPIVSYGSEDKIWEIWDEDKGSSGDWLKVPGVRGFTFDGGTREGRSVSTDSNDPTGKVGTLTAPSATISSIVSPGHRAWQLITDSVENRDKVRCRLTLAKNAIIDLTTGSDTAAIATTGVVTWAGVTPPRRHLREGARIRIGSDNYWISTVNQTNNEVTVDPAPSSAVNAANYSIDAPQIRFEFEGFVTQSPVVTPSLDEAGEYEGDTMIQLESTLDRPTVVN